MPRLREGSLGCDVQLPVVAYIIRVPCEEKRHLLDENLTVDVVYTVFLSIVHYKIRPHYANYYS